jgi:hypothetical protein
VCSVLVCGFVVFCNVWLCVCVGFVMCGCVYVWILCMCGFYNVWVCVCGFAGVCVCVCVGFVMCGCVCVGVPVCVCVCVDFVMCGCPDNVYTLNLFGYPD